MGLRPVLVKSQRDLAGFQARLGPWRFEVKGYVARVSDEIDLVCVKLMRVRGVPSRNDRMTKVFADQQ